MENLAAAGWGLEWAAVVAVAEDGPGHRRLARFDPRTGKAVGAPLSYRAPLPRPFGPQAERVFLPPGTGAALTVQPRARVRREDAVTGAPAGPSALLPDAVGAHALAADGKAPAAAHGADLQTWDLTTGKPLGPRLEHPGAIDAITFRPDSRALAVVCREGQPRRASAPQRWHAAGGRQRATG